MNNLFKIVITILISGLIILSTLRLFDKSLNNYKLYQNKLNKVLKH